MANKLIDWLIAQVSHEEALSTIIVSCVCVCMNSLYIIHMYTFLEVYINSHVFIWNK